MDEYCLEGPLHELVQLGWLESGKRSEQNGNQEHHQFICLGPGHGGPEERRLSDAMADMTYLRSVCSLLF